MTLDTFLERAAHDFGASPAEVAFLKALAGPVSMHGVAWINESLGFGESLAATGRFLATLKDGAEEHFVGVLIIEANRETNDAIHEAVAAVAESIPEPEARRRTWASGANEWIRAREQGRAIGLVATRIRASRTDFHVVPSQLNRAVTRIVQPTKGAFPLVVVNYCV